MNKQEKIYFAIDETHAYVKIGRSSNPEGRFKTLKTSNPFLTMLLIHDLPFWCEQVLHDFYEPRRIKGEWYNFTDLKESSVPFTKVIAIELMEVMNELDRQVQKVNDLPTRKTRHKNRSNKQVMCFDALLDKFD